MPDTRCQIPVSASQALSKLKTQNRKQKTENRKPVALRPMTIHKEGFKSILIGGLIFLIINLVSFRFLSGNYPITATIIFIVTLGVFLFLISFFRVPDRSLVRGENLVIAPADGKVVVIEEAFDEEYLKKKDYRFPYS